MIFQRLGTFLMVLLTIAVVLVGTAGTGFAQGLVEYALVLVLAEAPGQTVLIRNEDGEPLGPGTIRAYVTAGEDGVVSGEVTISFYYHLVHINVSAVDYVLDAQGRVVQVDLFGLGRYAKDGQEQFSFPAMVEVRPATAVPPSCVCNEAFDEGFELDVFDTSIRPVFGGYSVSWNK